MRAHVVEDGLVVNTVEVDSLGALPNLIDAEEGGIGWSYKDGVFTAPYEPETDPREFMTVTNRGLRLALNDAGVYGNVESAMAKSTNTAELEIYWNHSTTINRLDPWIVAVAEGMGLTDEQVDSIFEEASTYG